MPEEDPFNGTKRTTSARLDDVAKRQQSEADLPNSASTGQMPEEGMRNVRASSRTLSTEGSNGRCSGNARTTQPEIAAHCSLTTR